MLPVVVWQRLSYSHVTCTSPDVEDVFVYFLSSSESPEVHSYVKKVYARKKST
jgi:hypothetical protein